MSKTNGEWLRSLNNEELSKWFFADRGIRHFCKPQQEDNDGSCPTIMCKDCFCDWLNKEREPDAPDYPETEVYYIFMYYIGAYDDTEVWSGYYRETITNSAGSSFVALTPVKEAAYAFMSKDLADESAKDIMGQCNLTYAKYKIRKGTI